MVISIVTRKTSVTERAPWPSRLEGVLPTITEAPKAEAGFAGGQYLWGADDDGVLGHIPRWDAPARTRG